MRSDDSDDVWYVRNAGMSAWTRTTTDEIKFDEMYTGLIETMACLPIDREPRFPLVDRREDFNTSHQAGVSRIADLHVDDPNINGWEDWERKRGRYAHITG